MTAEQMAMFSRLNEKLNVLLENQVSLAFMLEHQNTPILRRAQRLLIVDRTMKLFPQPQQKESRHGTSTGRSPSSGAGNASALTGADAPEPEAGAPAKGPGGT